MSNSRYLRLGAGLALLAILVVSVDGDELLAQFAQLRPELLVAAAVCIVTATLVGSYNAYLVVAIDSPVPFTRFAGYYWFSWALGLVVPGQIGDVASLTYLMKRAGLDWTRMVGRALLDKLISFAVMVSLAGFALVRFSAVVDIDGATLVWISIATFAVAAGGAWLAKSWLARSERGTAIRERIRSSVKDVVAFTLGHPGLVAINVLGTTVKILLIGTAYWYVFRAGGAASGHWLDIVLLVTVSSLVAYIPVSFNGLGTVEITGIVLFALLGLGEELVLSSYLVLRATVILIAWIPSLLILLASGKDRRQALR